MIVPQAKPEGNITEVRTIITITSKSAGSLHPEIQMGYFLIPLI